MRFGALEIGASTVSISIVFRLSITSGHFDDTLFQIFIYRVFTRSHDVFFTTRNNRTSSFTSDHSTSKPNTRIALPPKIFRLRSSCPLHTPSIARRLLSTLNHFSSAGPSGGKNG